MRLQMSGFAICMVLCFALSALAQVPTAQITGVITDPAGSVVPTAEVTLTNEATGIVSKTMVNAEGRYLALALLPGRYTISVSANGFKNTVIKGVLLEVAHEARLDVQLEVGAVGERVTVTAVAPLLQSEGAGMGAVIDQRVLAEMPLNGRSFVELATLAPGASEGWSNGYQKLFFGKRSEYSIVETNGLRSEYTSTTLDGVNMQTNFRHWTSEIYPSVDMLQEFKSETSNYNAEFSKTGGVVLNLASKSGTNEVHGSAFEFLQNRVLNARNFFQAPTLAKPNEIYNQFGGTVGGPIWLPHIYNGKNKTFFFMSYQGLRIRNAFVSQTRVPTQLEFQGNFSESLAVGQILRDPATTVADSTSPTGYSRSPFSGNIMPANRILNVSKEIAGIGYPLPNNPANRSFNFQQAGTNPTTADQWSGRIDHKISDKDSLFARWTQDERFAITQGILPDHGSISLYNAYNGTLGWNHIFSPTILNEVRFGYLRSGSGAGGVTQQVVLGPGGLVPDYPGLANVPADLRLGLNFFSINGLASPNFGALRTFTPQNVYQLNDRVSWIHGKHTISFGAAIRKNEEYDATGATDLSSWNFQGVYTSTPYQYNPAQNYDTGFGDFLLGLGFQLTTGGQIFPKKRIYLYNWETNLFVDDKVRLLPNLTISLGLGYQYTTSFYEKQNYVSRFDLGKGQLVWPQSVANQVQPYEQYFHFPFRTDGPNAMFNMPALNFQPRIAIAYSPWDNKTVIRTGFGLYDVPYSTANITPMADPFPFSLGGSQQTSDQLFPSGAFNLGLPAPNLTPDLANAFATPSLQLGDPDVRTPYVEMWNFNVQHEFAHDIVVTAGYVGNTAKHLNMIIRRNAPPPGPGALNPRRPYPQFSRFINITWQGISNYNALQTNLTKRFKDGSQVIASYAYGKALGNTDELVSIATSGGTEVQNLLPYDYGRSSFDFRHILRTGFVYALPVGRGKQVLGSTNRVTDAVLGGWQLSGILTLQSGQAFTISGGANLNAERSSRPNRVCDGNLPGDKRTVQRDFDTLCFVTQAAFTDGTAGRNILSQRPLRSLNLGIGKTFTPFEQVRLQFRAEMFNATNTPAFAIPSSSCCGSTAFGQISATERDNRVVQMGLKLLF